ncbi:MAG: hypothetical protein FWG77_02025 [Treponema sp.]|nr:hypothetical protein [Treponema sp.]
MKKFIPILCCSKSKTVDSFCYENNKIKFVASPNVTTDSSNKYYTPDDSIPGSNKKWRDLVKEQNHEGLAQAYKLYRHIIYEYLYEKYKDSFYILSAGWGIIRSSYKIPTYDISFLKRADNITRRTGNMNWEDFNHLQDDINSDIIPSDAPIVLFAGKDYLNYFYNFALKADNRKIILYKSKKIIKIKGYEYEHFDDNASTNWFYKAAKNYYID